MNDTSFYLFFKVLARKLNIYRGFILLIDKTPSGYEVEEHLSTRAKVKPQMIST